MQLRSAIAAVAALSFVTSTVAAQPAPDEQPAADAAKPWARGVSDEDQKQANALFKEGNALMRDSFFVQAVEKYRAAVGHWDHPAIHFNLAIALINLDQPLELHASLEKALAYGNQALDDEKLELAERYKKLVEQQLSRVTISCTEPGAQVYVDGKEAFSCPGQEERLMRAGEHTFSASKPGFEAASVTRVLPGGAPETVALKLYRPEELTRYERHVAPWVPWAITGGGLALVGIGGLFHASASGKVRDFDQWVADCERDTGSACAIDAEAQALKDAGESRQRLAQISYGIGAAAVVTGVVFVMINRPRPYRIDAEQAEPRGVVIQPVLGRDEVGVSAALRF